MRAATRTRAVTTICGTCAIVAVDMAVLGSFKNVVVNVKFTGRFSILYVLLVVYFAEIK